MSSCERPPFVDPTSDRVECWICGTVDPEDGGGIGFPTDDEYIRKMAPVYPRHVEWTMDNGITE